MRSEVPTYEPDTQREDEDARQARWEAFLEVVRVYKRGIRWGTVLAGVADAVDGYRADLFAEQCANFAETEGWSGVLAAISHVLREEERYHRELMDRR